MRINRPLTRVVLPNVRKGDIVHRTRARACSLRAGVVAIAALLTALSFVAAAGAQAGPPSGAGVQPTEIAGNPTCAQLTPGTFELRINSPADGTFSDGVLTVTLDVRDTADGQVFDWTSNIGIDSIFVKGGPGGNLYVYDPEATSDTGLHAPINPSNGTFYGLSHISFCYDLEPAVEVEKTGDTLSKVGDSVTYQFTITNTGFFPLTLTSVTDTLLGDLAATAAANGCGSLAVGASCTFSVSRTVQAGDPDPLPNTVTVTYGATLPGGSTATVTDSDSHSVNLFQPSVTIDKSGDTLSKVGDPVNYTIVVTNTSSADSPNLTCTVSDPLLGISEQINLAPGATNTTNATYTVKAGDPDPLVNTASVDCTVDGFPNVLATQSDSHSVNLFQPSVAVDKTGPTEAVEGQTITYTYTITNTSSADSPALVLVSASDNVLGNLTAAATLAGCGTLAPAASCTFTATYTIPGGTPSPLVNTVTVLFNPTGFPNEITAQDTHSVVIRPALEGCTPGFWKNHLAAWAATGFSPNQTLESVFDVPDALGLDDATLLTALSFSGGGDTAGAARVLLRAAVAALLNSASPDVDYPLTTAQVIAAVNAALASGDRSTMLALAAQLDAFNNLGCPIGGTA
jgi:uncharacterized repeat protein (TIGR01451 family)